jgi:DNA-binding response OmpR family regulator
MNSATASFSWQSAAGEVVVVLFADPDDGLRIAYWLGESYSKVFQVLDGHHAAQILRKYRVGAVITDRVLPPWPGLDPFSLLRKSHPDLAIIYVGNGEAEGSSLARAAGATHVLPCPLRRQAVLDALPKGVAAA